SNISILALLCILPACQIKPRQVFKGGPNQAIEMGQIRVAKSQTALLMSLSSHDVPFRASKR
ncbi:MAG: hypothetical protein ACK6DX_18670, partial [Acidobacteriota bacterium]